MLRFFPRKRRFMPPITNLAALNHNLGAHSSTINQQPSQSAPEVASCPTPTNSPVQDELQPILENRSVTVKPQDRGKQLVEQFAELYSNLDSADISIACGRNYEILKAHRLVLSIGSAYFQDALKVAPCKYPIVVVKSIPGDIMGRILEYLYLGQVTLQSDKELKEFLNSAKYLQVFGICDEQYSVEH